MSVVKRISLLCALLCAAGAAHAISLGAIELESALNQPLRATVPLRGVESDELSGLRVRLAPAERFEAAGLIRDDYLRNLRLSAEEDQNGRPVVRIRGEGPLREPMLDLLIELHLGRQNVQRGYTLLVDPPEMAREPSAAGPEPGEARPASAPEPKAEPPSGAERSAAGGRETDAPAASEASSQPSPTRAAGESASAEPDQSAEQSPRFFEEREPASERQLDPELLAEIEAGRDRPQPRAARSATQPPPARSAEDGVYEVRAGETLWRVAYNTRGSNRDITMEQQMLAIVIANPNAFDGGDARALLRGSRLRIPPSERVRSIDAAEAEATMAALTAGERRTGAVDPGLMRSDAAPASRPQPEADEQATEAGAATETEVAVSDGQAGEPEPEVDGTEDNRADEAPAAGDQEAAADADPDAAALLVDRALTEAQRRAAEAEASEEDEIDPVPEQAQADTGDPTGGAGQAADAPPEDAPGVEDDAAQPAQAPSPAPVAAGDGGIDLRLLAAVAAVVLLLAALLVWRRRRAAAEEAAAEEEWDTGETQPATFEIGDDMAATGGEDAPEAGEAGVTASPESRAAAGEGDDPMADADFRIAYGMFDDAEARLQDAIRHEPERADLRLKLAEVHHAAEQREAFLEAADAASGCGLDDEQRRELARMADRIAPDSRHASGTAAGAVLGAGFAGESDASATAEPSAGAPIPAEGEPGVSAAPPEQDLDLSGLDTETGGALDEPETAGEGELDFDLDQLDDLKSDDVKESVAPALDEGSADNLLDFDLEALETEDSGGSEVATAEPDTRAQDDNSLDFDLDALDFDSDEGAATSEAAASRFDDGGTLDVTEGEADAGSAEPAAEAAAASDADAPELDLDDFSLADFDVSGDAESGEPEPELEPAAGPVAAQEPPADSGEEDFAIGGLDLEPEGEPAEDEAGAMAGQLDMARAYVDLGDIELARPMLQEVAERGDADQQRQAAELLEKLG